ncbi:hypothetical protein [Sneathiella sp.]
MVVMISRFTGWGRDEVLNIGLREAAMILKLAKDESEINGHHQR